MVTQNKRGFEKFGDYLKFKRLELNFSQNDLELKTQMDRTYISMLENKGNPSFSTIKHFCDAMGITLEEFFRVSQHEAKPPTILVNFRKEETEKKFKESILKNEGVPIPIIKSDKPLKSGIVEVEDIRAYIVLDRETLGAEANSKLVAVQHIPSIPFPLMIIDLESKTLEEGQVYTIEKNGIKIRKIYDTGNGLILQPIFGQDKPTALFGKQKSFLKILGRVVLALFSVGGNTPKTPKQGGDIYQA